MKYFLFPLRVLQWLIYLPLHVLTVLLRYPLAPIAVIFFSTPDRKHLTFFKFLETQDVDMGGDTGFQTHHITPGSDPYSVWNRIRWGFRNGCQTLTYRWFGVNFDKEWADSISATSEGKIFFVRPDGAWLLFIDNKPLFGRFLTIFFGFGIRSNINGKSKFSCTVRFKAKKG